MIYRTVYNYCKSIKFKKDRVVRGEKSKSSSFSGNIIVLIYVSYYYNTLLINLIFVKIIIDYLSNSKIYE